MSAVPRPRVSVDLLRAAMDLALDLKQRFKKSEGVSSIQAAVVPHFVGDSVTWEIQITYSRPTVHRLAPWIERVPRSIPVGEFVIPVTVRAR